MADLALYLLTLVTALGCGLVAGVFFAFSTFVMTALSRRPPHEAIAAMQSINVAVIDVWFLGVFLGTAAVCVGGGLVAALHWEEPRSGFVLLGSVLYLVGSFGVTLLCNVPRNNSLASLDPASAESADAWRTYVAGWTRWNHVRCVAALAAAASFCAALRS